LGCSISESASALQRQPPGAGEFDDAERLEQSEERGDLIVVAGGFDDERIGAEVNDFGAEDVG
jgi:hypothetical protein